ncbi:tetratricopeptide repeat protein [Desulfobacterales bacterium HSG16]|nr:tetratricopeptide repeat protein [Desulfobacterales bacterium HSG16]
MYDIKSIFKISILLSGIIFLTAPWNARSVNAENTESFENSRKSVSLYKRGVRAYKKNMYGEAIEWFEKAIETNEQNPSLYIWLGNSLFNRSDYESSKRAFENALSIKPDHFDAHFSLARIYYLTSEPELALEHMELASGIDPSSRLAQKYLVRLQKQIDADLLLENESNYIFSVSFDGDRNPELRNMVIDILMDAYFAIDYEFDARPDRQISVMLLTKEKFFDITQSPAWSGGVFEGQIKIPVSGYDLDRLKTVLIHEYVHAVIFHLMQNRCPWWLNEGLAQYFSKDEVVNAKKMSRSMELVASQDGIRLAGLPGKISKNAEKAFDSYSLALSATAFLFDDLLTLYQFQDLLTEMGQGKTFEQALEQVSDIDMEEFENQWIDSCSPSSF